MRNKKTNDSYEAAYYMMLGARVDRVVQRPISKHQQIKRGFRREWIIYLTQVPIWAIMGWNHDMPYGNIARFKKARMKLKKLIS